MTTKAELHLPETIDVKQPPKPFDTVVAITPSYACMAYMEQDGTWRALHSGKELTEVLGWQKL